MGLLELLAAEEVDRFNAERGVRGKVDLFAADLAGKDLTGADLSGADLQKADLTGTDLTDCHLLKANLSGIDGSGAKLIGAMGMRCRFKEAWLDGVDFSGADLTKADLSNAVLTGAVANDLILVGARLKHADAKKVKFPSADMSESHLAGADFTDADLRMADFTEASAAAVVLTNARLDGLLATRARLSEADFTHASMSGARMLGANLAGADLTGANLQGADLSEADLTGATLTDAQLQGASFAGACLDEVDLTGLDLSDVDLSGLDPAQLGLTDEQTAALSRYGVPHDPEAPLVVTSPTVGAVGKAIILCWRNDDSDELQSVRAARAVSGSSPADWSLVQVPPASVLSMSMVQTDAGLKLVMVVRRPSGVALRVQDVSAKGELGAPVARGFGYDPSVRPVISSVDGKICIWGLESRRGLLVVHGETKDGLVPVHSKPVPTAQGFLGRNRPALVCKGGVVLPLGPRGGGRPLRCPSGFPGVPATAATVGDRVMLAWIQKRRGDIPGGLRTSWLGGRGTPQVDAVTSHDDVLALEAAPWGEDRAVLAWTEVDKLSSRVLWALDAGDPVPALDKLDDASSLRLVSDGTTTRLVGVGLAGDVCVDKLSAG